MSLYVILVVVVVVQRFDGFYAYNACDIELQTILWIKHVEHRQQFCLSFWFCVPFFPSSSLFVFIICLSSFVVVVVIGCCCSALLWLCVHCEWVPLSLVACTWIGLGFVRRFPLEYNTHLNPHQLSSQLLCYVHSIDRIKSESFPYRVCSVRHSLTVASV